MSMYMFLKKGDTSYTVQDSRRVIAQAGLFVYDIMNSSFETEQEILDEVLDRKNDKKEGSRDDSNPGL